MSKTKPFLQTAVIAIFALAVFSGSLQAETDLFSVNFYAYGDLDPADYDAVTLEADESAGVGSWNTTGWENYEVPWAPTSPQPPVTITSIQGAMASLTLNDVRNGGPYVWSAPHTNLPGDGNGDLMDGHCNGTEDPGDDSNICDITVSDFPYGAYDVIVYLGANAAQFGDGTGKIIFNGGPEQDFTLTSGQFTAFSEITDGVTPGNYIVFQGVTGSSFNLKVWGNGFNHIGPTGFQIFVPDTSVTSPDDDMLLALTELKDHIEGTITLNASEIAAHKTTIDAEKFFFGTSVNVMAAAFDLVETYESEIGPLFVSGSPIQSFDRDSVSDSDINWVVYNVMQYIIDWTYTNSNVSTHQALFDGFKFESSDFFPGAAPTPTDPNAAYDVEINATVPTVWGKPVAFATDPARRPTGFYLAPGSIGKVTAPPSMVNQGFEILVGAHTWDKSNKLTIQRLDRITRTFPITSEVTSIANPLGGGIYIIVPYEADLGVVTIQIANAVRSPFFSATSHHQTTLQEWTDTERHHPGPWADFETDKFMMQVPTSWIYNYADPVTQMQKWDMAMDGMSELLGFPLVRNRTVLYVQPDLSIAHSAYGIGYPQVNQIYNPEAATNGNSSHFFLTNPIAWSTTYHELGHAQLFSKFPGHTEATVNLPYVYIATEKFGVDLVQAFTDSMVLAYLENMSVDQAALTWFVTENFRNGNPMDITNTEYNEVRYQHRGYGRYVDMAVLFGWNVISDFYHQESLDYMSGAPGDGLSSVDSRILRLSIAAGVDLTPLIHCWGVHPVDLGALQTAIATEGLPPSTAIYDRLVHYKDIIPADNDEFWDHYTTIYPSQPEGGNPLYQYGWYNVWKSIYDETHGTAAKNAMQDIIDLYFPYGAPKGCDYRCGDIDGSGGNADMGDFAEMAICWGVDPIADQNCICANLVEFDKHIIDLLDLSILAELFLSTSPDYPPNDCSASITDPYPPTPDPMSFLIPPYATGGTSIEMIATHANDISGVEYYFTCTAGGGHDSGWQSGSSYEDTGLTVDTQYTYTVKARDKSDAHNETAASSGASATTFPYENLVLPANGGILESFTSEYGSGWVVSDLTNGVTNEDGWASTENPSSPQEFVYSFRDGNRATLNEAVIHGGTAEGWYYSKDVEVWTSADGISFTLKGSDMLLAQPNDSVTINLGDVAAKKVKLAVTSGYDSDYWELAEFIVYGLVIE